MKNSNVCKKIGNILFYVVLISLLSISVIMVKSAKEGKQPTIMGHKFFTVLTGSMEPTIRVGDLIIAKETNPQDIKPGDIITFGSLNSDNITTHRVKEVLNENNEIKYITQGDANNIKDPSPIESKVLVGKVVKWIPKAGAIMAWMKSNLSLIIVVIIAITALGAIRSGLKNKLKSIDEEENKNKVKREKADAND